MFKKLFSAFTLSLFLLVCFVNTSADAAPMVLGKIRKNLNFIVPAEFNNPDYQPPVPTQAHIFDNGLSVEFRSFWHNATEGNVLGMKKNDAYYDGKTGFMGSTYYVVTIEGFTVELSNKTNDVRIIKWSESSLNMGSFSGIPFLGGMKYNDSGNPSATPDTILAPGQTVTKEVYVSRVKLVSNTWYILGAPVPRNNSLTATLILKVNDSKNNTQYCTLKSYPMGVINN